MEKHPVKYYFMCPETGVEMNFSKYPDWGWTVGFHNIDFEGGLDYRGKIPWPTLSAEEQAVVDENYKKLYKALEEGDEQS